jgi:uncharacterized protein (TIGR00369 family)
MTDHLAAAPGLSFDEKLHILKNRRSLHGGLIGLRLDRGEPGQAWSSLPFHPVFVGDTATGVLHGGVVTSMLDESCGMAVQLATPGLGTLATLDLRIDYLRPATPGQTIRAHAHCYRLTRSIGFVRAIAYQDSEADPVASAAATFMLGAHRADMLRQTPKVHLDELPELEAPEELDGPFARSPYPRFLGICFASDGTPVLPYAPKLVGNPVLPSLHGGVIGAFLETAAIVGVQREIGLVAAPKPIGLTVNYLRSGRPLDSYARVSIVKQGRRVVAFEAQAYQKDPAEPIASCYGHFMLPRESDSAG